MKRHKVSKSKSQRLFTQTAARVHGKNIPKPVMRGGIRF